MSPEVAALILASISAFLKLCSLIAWYRFETWKQTGREPRDPPSMQLIPLMIMAGALGLLIGAKGPLILASYDKCGHGCIDNKGQCECPVEASKMGDWNGKSVISKSVDSGP